MVVLTLEHLVVLYCKARLPVWSSLAKRCSVLPNLAPNNIQNVPFVWNALTTFACWDQSIMAPKNALIHTHSHAHTHTITHTLTHTTHPHILHTHEHTHVHVHTHTNTHAHTRTYMHTHSHSYITHTLHTRPRTHPTHTYTHSHTCRLSQAPASFPHVKYPVAAAAPFTNPPQNGAAPVCF
jgi:hypothetical protein